jgi:transcriptional regulator with XRE-family HTH domain
MPETMTTDERRALLREFRNECDLTLERLAGRADLSKAMLSQFENGGRDLSPETWQGVLDAMESVLAEDKVAHDKEISRLKKEAARLEKELAEQSAGNAGIASLLESVDIPGSTFGQFLADMLCPTREGAAERRKTRNADFQRRFGTDGGSLLEELTRAQKEVKKLRESLARALAALAQSHVENAELKEWLDQEVVAAMAQEKALTLRMRVHEKEASLTLAPEPESPLAVRIFEKLMAGEPITDAEHEQARKVTKAAKILKRR